MANEITNTQDIIDSRNILERIEELEDQITPCFVAGYHMPGYMLDNPPEAFDDIEDARRYVSGLLDNYADDLHQAIEVGAYITDTERESLKALLERVEKESKALLESDEPEYSEQFGPYLYWITEDGTMGLDDDEQEELHALKELAEQCERYSGDWKYGATLIRDDYFEEYAQELAEDLGLINGNASWPNNCIDWEQAANDLKYDYTSVDFNGVTYWIR